MPRVNPGSGSAGFCAGSVRSAGDDGSQCHSAGAGFCPGSGMAGAARAVACATPAQGYSPATECSRTSVQRMSDSCGSCWSPSSVTMVNGTTRRVGRSRWSATCGRSGAGAGSPTCSRSAPPAGGPLSRPRAGGSARPTPMPGGRRNGQCKDAPKGCGGCRDRDGGSFFEKRAAAG